MFAVERWGQAFLNVCEKSAAETGDTYEAGLSVLRAVATVAAPMKGRIAGSTAAAKLESLLRGALSKLGYREKMLRCVETALASVFLLVKKEYFSNLSLLIQEIEQLIAQKKHIVTVYLECAQEPESSFVESVRKAFAEKTGASKVNVKVAVKPELISGCRLSIGSDRQDFSMARQLEQMEQALKEDCT
jgi:F0F1-type ATP synthase delta subunit